MNQMLTLLSLLVRLMTRILLVIFLIFLFSLWVIVAIELAEGIGNSIMRINREDDEK